MLHRKLGRSEVSVPTVSFGAWAIGGSHWGGADDDEAVRAIHAAIDAGMDAIDTAPIYGFGHSESVIGRAIEGRRDRVVLMTKVGLRWDDERGDIAFSAPGPHGKTVNVRLNSRPWSVRYEVEKSLTRLGVDVLDLVQIHWPDPRTPVTETLDELLSLRREGKLRAIGVSNFSVGQLEDAGRALGEIGLASDQPKYSLLDRAIERDVLPWCRQRGVGVLPYSPLEQGLLTGKVTAGRAFPEDDGRSRKPSFSTRNRALVNAALDRVVRPIAERHGATVGQVVVAWTAAQPGVTSVLVGVRTAAQARENAAAGALALDAAELAAIRGGFEGLRLDLPGGGGVLSGLKRLARRALGG